MDAQQTLVPVGTSSPSKLTKILGVSFVATVLTGIPLCIGFAHGFGDMMKVMVGDGPNDARALAHPIRELFLVMILCGPLATISATVFSISASIVFHRWLARAW